MNQSGTTFTQAIKNAINMSLYRIARECAWRSLRRKATFDTVTSYTTGTGAANVTYNSKNVTVTGATFITDAIKIGRRIKFGGSGTYYKIATITGETTLTLDQVYGGTSSAVETYEIMPQEEYNLPTQATHRMFMWHEGFGYPFMMNYISDQEFYNYGLYLTIKYLPTHYRMWGEDMVLSQPLQPSVITISSATDSPTTYDLNIPITVFGIVNGYPDYEVIYTSATDSSDEVSSTKSFSSVERVVKGLTSRGIITVTSNTAYNTVAKIPVGSTTTGIVYRKIQLYPLPNKVFTMNVQYYKDPYELVNDNDVHELGKDFDEAIILLATAKIKGEANLAESDRFTLLFMDELKSLKKVNADKIDWFPTLHKPKAGLRDALVTPNLLYKQAGGYYGPASRNY